MSQEQALLEQIEQERAMAADAVKRAFAAGWNACTRDRLSCTSETAFVRWVGKQSDDMRATQVVTYRDGDGQVRK